MKKQIYIAISTALIALINACVSTPPVYNVHAPQCPKNNQGIFYALPQTIVTADFVISKTTVTQAPFADFAAVLGLKNTPGTTFKIEEYKIGSNASVDSAQWYFVDLSKKCPFNKITINTSMSETGIIATGNYSAENKSVEYVTSVLDFAAGVAARFIPFTTTQSNSDKHTSSGRQTNLINTATSLHQDSARIFIQQLNELEENRAKLISNQSGVSVSAEALQLMLKEIDSKETEILSLFVGEKKVKKTSLHFTTADAQNDQVLFHFSSKEGISGLPSSTDIDPEFTTSGNAGDAIMIRFTAESLPKNMSTASATTSKKSGFYYRIPVNTTIHIQKGSTIVAENTIPVAQNGVVKSLPAKTGGMKTSYELKYDPKTGALLELKVNGEPLSEDNLDKLSSTGQKILDVVKPDELSELEKQRQILEEKQKIKELQQKQ